MTITTGQAKWVLAILLSGGIATEYLTKNLLSLVPVFIFITVLSLWAFFKKPFVSAKIFSVFLVFVCSLLIYTLINKSM